MNKEKLAKNCNLYNFKIVYQKIIKIWRLNGTGIK